jgi:aminoglycoside phosphotransferase (APT) family kinase protein
VLASKVDGPDGRPFILMERVDGGPMLGSSPGLVALLRLPDLIVKAQAQLHSLDPERFLDAMEEQGYRRRHFSSGFRAKRIAQRMERKGFDWLRPAIAWLQEHQPPEQDVRVVCHGDLHGRNALSRGGAVTGVIDWQSVAVADPMLDVGNTMMSIVPSRGLSPTVRMFSGVLRRRVQAQYLRAYGRTRPVRMESVRYYAALRLMSRLVRRKTPDAARAASFYDLTGVRLELPLP